MPKSVGTLPLFEDIPSEAYDHEVALHGYDILSYPADFTLEVLVTKWKKGEIQTPPLQRRYVWNQVRASKLIESFLMGLPVPPVFFYQERGTNKLLVVDGQQRLRSLVYYFSGKFGEPNTPEQTNFNLIGLDERSPYFNYSFEGLREQNEEAFNKLNNSVLRAFVVKQIDPADDTSIFQIFERLNTGGVILQGQEIRNCLYDGTFNTALNELNKYTAWRKILGRKDEDKRKRDVELVLRFLALFYNRRAYKKPMKQFLNVFMRSHKRAEQSEIDGFKRLFTRTADAVLEILGEKPFHIHTGLNAAVFDSIFTAFAENLNVIDAGYGSNKDKAELKARYKELTKDQSYLKLVTTGTTDQDIIPKRIKKAEKVLFGK